eukprot:CAMPEP_0115534436 /NCGR_PEP_ID=MMETSP0271-20121206/86674_1 /TAXON_ID=71861 /ORGANISM="Scrippsiella trochoidea, Strain CCMP3099" /LENGTH=51 /DNA_ID=CAMNT_0002966925 /DNA_START=18 /DNA_END=169 /DNA_ORIENTATION=+
MSFGLPALEAELRSRRAAGTSKQGPSAGAHFEAAFHQRGACQLHWLLTDIR